MVLREYLIIFCEIEKKKNVFIKNVKKRKLLRLGVSTGQVGLDLVGRQSGRSKLKICCQRFKSAATACFLVGSSPDLSKNTRSEQNNTISLPDLRKTHRILAKNYQIFIGFEKNSQNLCRIWVKPS